MTIPTNQVNAPGIGVITGDQLNTYVQTDVTATQLRAFIGVAGMAVTLQGIVSANDGLGGVFYWNPGTGFVDDNLNTIVPPAASSGAWIRLTLDVGAAIDLVVGTTVITGGTTGEPLYDNGGILGQAGFSVTSAAANVGLFGPSSGAAAAPSFRALVTADMPASVALLASPTFTGTPAAPTAASTTSTTQIATTAFANPGSSLTINGSYKLPGGLIVNWNFVTTNSSGLYTWTFQTAFTTSIFYLGATISSSAASTYTATISGLSSAQAGVATTNGSTGATSAVFVLAIGY